MGYTRRSRSLRGAILTLIAGALLLPSVAAAEGTAARSGTPLLRDNFESMPTGEWADGARHGKWRSVFNGYGSVGIAKWGTKLLKLRPAISSSSSETHAALATTAKSFGDLDLTMRMKTVKQLRKGNPNPWEVAWALWHYQDNTHFYYLALKPNGWELGKADPAYPGAQRFLASGSNPHYAIGKWHNVRVRQVGRKISVWANGTLLTRFTDRERPYRQGTVAAYNEDAKTLFDDVKVRVP